MPAKDLTDQQMDAATDAAFPARQGPTLNGMPLYPLWVSEPTLCPLCTKAEGVGDSVYCEKCQEYARMFCGGK